MAHQQPALDLDDLPDLFGFTPEELALNRAGRFSTRQRQQVRYHSVGYLVRGAAFLVLCMILAVTLIPLLHRAGEWIAFVGVCLTVIGLIVWWGIAAARIARPVVRTITGPLTRAGSANRPVVRVGDLDLRISYRRWKRLPPVLADLSPTGRYRVYYCAESTLLSLEPDR
ncbi:MAG: hypothetical protein JXQ72_16140 [Anaerolineae bacterium]|nr:hypothetical protein [Anaerolineae bacterium]